MRHIYLRIKDPSNFRTRTFEDHSVTYGAIVNGAGQQVILHKPRLCRKIVSGVFIEDHWGDVPKWFRDHASSIHPLWGEV